MIKSDNQKGFTLVEVLVAAFIFSIIATAVSAIFISTLNDERRGFAAQKIQENGLYIMELMAREIRVSKIENQDDTGCNTTTLTITHPVNGTVTYSLNTGLLQRTAGGIVTELNTNDVAFSRLNFCIVGSNPTDKNQVLVTIIAGIQNKTGKEILTFNLQTSVSSRNVETEFSN